MRYIVYRNNDQDGIRPISIKYIVYDTSVTKDKPYLIYYGTLSRYQEPGGKLASAVSVRFFEETLKHMTPYINYSVYHFDTTEEIIKKFPEFIFSETIYYNLTTE